MKWHHSLYWRIAAGFVACLALLLIVQGMLFVWVASRSGSSVPNQPPDRFAQTIALDITQEVERDPALDIEKYVRQEYAKDAQPFFVLLADGKTIEMGDAIGPTIIEEARARLDGLKRREPLDRVPPRGQGEPFDRGNPQGPGEPFGRGRGGFGGRDGGGPPFDRGGPYGFRGGGPGPFRPAPIITGGRVLGLVVVPPRPPFSYLLARYAPTLAIVALATLIVGAVLATGVIFGPARKRLRAVEDAARRLGAGDLSARAPARGDDEVAAVATAFNAMADDLSARADALAASDRARRQLLADVSHELTTPVTAMRGYLETLSMPELNLDSSTRARYLSIIGDETARLERMIGDLLDLARLEGGGGALSIGEARTADVFERVRARHERALADAGVLMQTEIGAGADIMRVDRDRLEQALQNLAANALRYAPTASTITLGARREGDQTVLTVTDEGGGITPEHLPHVFDRFYKADASRAVRQSVGGVGGSGLGLSIVKAIVERHGGSVSARSEPGRTVFELRVTNDEL